jgi:hypothetical protein
MHVKFLLEKLRFSARLVSKEGWDILQEVVHLQSY